MGCRVRAANLLIQLVFAKAGFRWSTQFRNLNDMRRLLEAAGAKYSLKFVTCLSLEGENVTTETVLFEELTASESSIQNLTALPESVANCICMALPLAEGTCIDPANMTDAAVTFGAHEASGCPSASVGCDALL